MRSTYSVYHSAIGVYTLEDDAHFGSGETGEKKSTRHSEKRGVRDRAR